MEDLPELQGKALETEFDFGDENAEGLGVAYLLDGLAISLLSRECWNAASLELRQIFLSEAEASTLLEEQVSVRRSSSSVHVLAHRLWIERQLKEGIQDGADLWNRRETLFRHLAFCGNVAEQLAQLPPLVFNQVRRRLFELDDYCSKWTKSHFDPAELPAKANVESEATLNQYGSSRAFLCPDGSERVFSWHIRLTPGAWRVYIYPDPETRGMIIGYIGLHLPTARYN